MGIPSAGFDSNLPSRTACFKKERTVESLRAIDELEAYLPQLAHMLTRLPTDSLLTSVLERFVLRVGHEAFVQNPELLLERFGVAPTELGQRGGNATRL